MARRYKECHRDKKNTNINISSNSAKEAIERLHKQGHEDRGVKRRNKK